MNLKNLDLKISVFFEKYYFFSDLIFLFNPKKLPREEDYYKQRLNLKYPLIDQALENIEEIKKWYKDIKETYNKVNFSNDFFKKEYKKRINKIGKIISLIEVFYKEDEQEKFDLITNYFWVDLDFCINEILENYEIIDKEFKKIEKNAYLFDDLYIKYKNFKDKKFDAKDIKFYFEKALKYLKIKKYWKVVITYEVSSIVHWEFNQNWWKIFIPKNKVVNFERLIALIIHEIDAHCRQFTNKNKYWLYSWDIRFANSEEFVEWFAIYLETIFYILFFRNNIYKNRYINFKLNLDFVEGKIDYKKYIDNYSKYKFRSFRWFRNIKKFINTKDLVYTQWLYKTIKYKNLYWENFLKHILDWTINENCFLKFWKKTNKNLDILKFIKNSSACYTLKYSLKTNIID